MEAAISACGKLGRFAVLPAYLELALRNFSPVVVEIVLSAFGSEANSLPVIRSDMLPLDTLITIGSYLDVFPVY